MSEQQAQVSQVNPKATVGYKLATYAADKRPDPRVYREAARYLHDQPYYHYSYALTVAYDKIVGTLRTGIAENPMLLYAYLTQFSAMFQSGPTDSYMTVQERVLALLLMADICENP